MAKYKLGEIAPIQQGNIEKNDKYWLLNLDMVESNSGRVIDYLYVEPSEIGTSTVVFDKKNVLYSKLRPYLNKVVLPQCSGYATSEMLPLRPNTAIITRKYLTYFLRSPGFVSYISEKTSGAKMPRANTSDLKSVEIECPSLDEQNRITCIFDQLVSIISLREQELRTLDDLIKARFVEMFGDPETNPRGWKKRHLADLITTANNGMARRGNDEDGNIVIRLVELQDGYIDYSRPNRIVLTDTEKKRYLLKDKDFLFARVNGNPENVGRCAVFYDIGEPVFHNDHIIRVHFDDKAFDGPFASALLNSEYGKRQLRNQIKTSAGQYTVSQDGIGAIVAILPPIEIQRQFASIVAQVDKSKVVIKKALEDSQILFDSLMQEYFG